MSGILVVVSGASGAGKSTVLGLVMADMPCKFSVSVTTRDPRPHEVDGKDYHFIAEAEFHRMREQSQLLEWAEVHGHYYGTPRRFIEDNLAAGCDVLLDIDVQGMEQVRRQMPDAVLVFVSPPSLLELRERLSARGTEDGATLERRLARAQQEMDRIKEYHYLIINRQGEQEVAASRLKAVLIAEKCRVSRSELPDTRTPAPK
ncbi:MAG: guanylate kinase [Candidatus Xenobia bacterium]